MQTRNLTIMFTDMKGFTHRTSTISREEMQHLLDSHDRLLRPYFAKYNGTVVKTIGDAFMVTFESPTNAVLCGIQIQNAVYHHNKQAHPSQRFEVRMAVNAGDVYVKEDGDVFGEPVNIAARIESLAEPYQVYFTEAVYLTMNRNEVPVTEVGGTKLKGIPDTIQLYKILPGKGALKKVQEERKLLAEQSANLSKKDPTTVALPQHSAGSQAPSTPHHPAPSHHKKKSLLSQVFTFLLFCLFLVAAIIVLLFWIQQHDPVNFPSDDSQTQSE